jgi:hypothetical protein
LFPGAEVPGGLLLSPTLKIPPGTCGVTAPFGEFAAEEETEGAAMGVITGFVKVVAAGAEAGAEAGGMTTARLR